MAAEYALDNNTLQSILPEVHGVFSDMNTEKVCGKARDRPARQAGSQSLLQLPAPAAPVAQPTHSKLPLS